MTQINKEDLIQKIGNIYTHRLTQETYETYEISPVELCLDKRIDIIIKLICIPQILNEYPIQSNFLETMYKEHIKCITEGSYKENGSNSKNNFDEFKKEFKKICISINNTGFNENISLIPITKDLIPINGAHRIAAAIYYKKNINIVVIPEITEINYGISFFRKRFLDEKYLNSALIKLFEISNKYVLGIVWPASGISAGTLNNLLLTNIIDHKSVSLTHEGFHNVVCEAYSKEKWLGSPENCYNGAWGKVQPCMGSNNQPAHFFILKTNENIIKLKEKLRDNIGIGKHSIHICDDSNDSLPLLRYIYNVNFNKIVNYSHYRYNKFLRKTNSLSSSLKEKSVNPSDIIINGSALLGVLGLREPNDLDYLSFEDKKLSNADWHNDYLHFHESNLIDLLLDQENYVYVYGLKFISPNAFKTFKKNRNETKDRIDINLLSSFEEKSKFQFLKYKFSSKYIFYRYKLLVILVRITEFLGIKNSLKKLLKRH